MIEETVTEREKESNEEDPVARAAIEYEDSNKIIPSSISSITQHLIDLIEKRIAEKVLLDGISQMDTRAKYWIPLADMLLNCMNKDRGSRVQMYELVHRRIYRRATYARTNTYLETIRRSMQLHLDVFPVHRYGVYLYVYDPYLPIDYCPTQEQFRQFLSDIDVDPNSFEIERTEDVKSTIPHILPGLGSMSIKLDSNYTRLEDMGDIIKVIVPEATIPALPFISTRALDVERMETMYKWVEQSCVSLGVRLMIVNMEYGMINKRSLIKYYPKVSMEAVECAGKILTGQLVRKLNPFSFPTDEDLKDVNQLGEEGSLTHSLVTRPYTIIGGVGPMGVVLDYAIGNGKYKLDQYRYMLLYPILGAESRGPVLSTVAPSTNLGIFGLTQFISFLRYRCPNRFSAVDVETEESKVLESGVDPVVTGFRYIDSLRDDCMASGSLCMAVSNAFKYRLRHSINEDRLYGIIPYSPRSSSEKVIREATIKIRSLR